MIGKPLVVVVEDVESGAVSRSAFIKSPVRVGRGELNDLVIEAPFVSTWHGIIQFESGEFRFVDLGSTNGTFLDGARLDRNSPAVVVPESDLRIGPLNLRLSWGTAEQPVESPRPRTQFAMRAVEAVAAAQARPSAVSPPAAASGAPVAPRAPGAGAPQVTSEEEAAAQRAVEDASWQLGILHEAYLQAQGNLDAAILQATLPLSEGGRRRARALVADRFPSGAAAAASAPEPSSGRAADSSSADLLRVFAQSYLPGGVALEGRSELEQFLGGLAEVLETSVKSYLELRRGYDEFGREMGVRVPQGEGAVGRFRDARQLLGYLLQPATTGTGKARELATAFADLMIHQVALLNGVTAGARDLLDRLSPEAITAAVEEEGGGRLALGVKTLREGAQWRGYLSRYAEIADEENALSDALFGKAFARAYSAVAGKRDVGGREGADDSTPRPG
jgi:type VI secretion system FHA domain protein